MINKYGEGIAMQISQVFGLVYRVTCWRVLWKRSFLTFIWARLSQSTILEIYKLWGSSFFQNVRNLIYISKRQKNIRIVFSFLDICIWIGRVNLSLLGREYLSLVVNMLTNSRKIFCIAKRDFFQLNSIHSDQ